jgi:hypothetical protein
MKNIITVVLLSILIMSFNPKNDNTLLYQQSLLNHLSDVKTDTVYILKCFDIELPSKIGKYTIVDVSGDIRSFLVNNSSLYAIKLMPIEINKGAVEITLIDYILKIDAGEIVMSNAGSAVFSYKYESQTKKYRLLKKSKNTL